MLTQVGSNQPFGVVGTASSLAEALKQAETYCKDCKASSPMVCVERCDVWRVKNEILSVRQITSEKDHAKRLLNTLKNPRRIKILDALCEQPRSLKDVQRYLKRERFCHSRSTIKVVYVKPLINAGLVREDGARFKVTFYGRKVHDLLHKIGLKAPLPIHSGCYEEIVIRELMSRPRSFDELTELVPRKSLSRVLLRLRTKGLLSGSLHGEYVFYHKMKGKPRIALSPTEKRVLNIIPLDGISARQVSKEGKITPRRTYKYLRRLREKKLVFALKKPRTYALTTHGREIGALLDEINKLVASTAIMVLQR